MIQEKINELKKALEKEQSLIDVNKQEIKGLEKGIKLLEKMVSGSEFLQEETKTKLSAMVEEEVKVYNGIIDKVKLDIEDNKKKVAEYNKAIRDLEKFEAKYTSIIPAENIPVPEPKTYAEEEQPTVRTKEEIEKEYSPADTENSK